MNRKLKEQLYNYKEEPPNIAWKNIVAKMNKKPQSYFYFWKISAAIFLVLCLIIGFNYLLYRNTKSIKDTNNTASKLDSTPINTKPKLEENIVNDNVKTSKTNIKKKQAQQNKKENIKESLIFKKNELVEKTMLNKNLEKHNPQIQDINDKKATLTKINSLSYKLVPSKNNNINVDKNSTLDVYLKDKIDLSSHKESKNIVTGKTLNKNIIEIPLQLFDENLSNEILVDNLQSSTSKSIAKLDQKNTKKWSVQAFYSPVLISSTSKENSLIPELKNYKNEFANTRNFGLKTSYNISNKVFLRMGIAYLSLEQKTYNITLSTIPTDEQITQSNIKYIGNMTLMKVAQITNKSVEFSSVTLRPMEYRGAINQQIEYTLFPLEVGYEFFKSNKISVNSTIGGAAYILSQNRLYFKNETLKQEIGKATNLNPLSFSAQLGLEFNYQLYKNFHLNLQPSFKYFINTFSSSFEVRPISVGINTGVNFRL